MGSRILLVFVTVIAMSFAMAAIYTWADEHGVTHFSQSLPRQGAPTFSPEMGDPRHRTPRSTVGAARLHVERLCPDGE